MKYVTFTLDVTVAFEDDCEDLLDEAVGAAHQVAAVIEGGIAGASFEICDNGVVIDDSYTLIDEEGNFIDYL